MLTDRDTLITAAALFAGVLVGGTMGPVLFTRTGLNVPFSSLMGSVAASLLAYGMTRGFVVTARRQEDRKLEFAANSILREAGLAPRVLAAVQNSHVLLRGEVEQLPQRRMAEQALTVVPGVEGVTNHIHLRFTGQRLNAEEIKRRMANSFLQHAELDAQDIEVRVQESGIVLEGTVHTSEEATEAEELAWHIEGIEEVENRLRIAA